MPDTSVASRDIVSVFTYGSASHRAECSCGWQNKQRVLKARAVFDAYMHAGDTGCRDNEPLVYDFRGDRPTDAPSLLQRIGLVGCLAAALAIPIVGFLQIAPARADDTLTNVQVAYIATYGDGICKAITAHHNKDGVFAVGTKIMTDGFTAAEAVEIINVAVATSCPENWALLKQIGEQARAAQGSHLV